MPKSKHCLSRNAVVLLDRPHAPGARGFCNPIGWAEPATISHEGTSPRCMFSLCLEFAQQRPLEKHQERQTDGREIIVINTGSHFQSSCSVPSSVSTAMGLRRVGHDSVPFTSLHFTSDAFGIKHRGGRRLPASGFHNLTSLSVASERSRVASSRAHRFHDQGPHVSGCPSHQPQPGISCRSVT